MTENEKVRELIATSETTVKVDPQNGWYLKRFAALQFEGSVDNFSTNMPIHVLEQQLPKDDTMKLDDAVAEGQDIDYSKFYDEDGCSYSSVSELVEVQLGLDTNDAGTAMQLGENLSCALRDGGYQVTNAVEVDE